MSFLPPLEMRPSSVAPNPVESRAERQLGLGGIHHLSHEEGRLGVSIVEDAEEGSVELDVWGKGHGDGFQKHGPSSFCPFLIDGQRSLVERLEAGRATRSCVSGDSPHPGLGARRGASVISDSLRAYGLWPARILCPWDSLGKNTGVGCHAVFQGIFLTRHQTHVSYVSCTGR